MIWGATPPPVDTGTLVRWWEWIPAWAKIVAAVAAIAFLVIGLVRRLVALAVISAMVAGGLFAWWWWAERGSLR